MTSRRLAFFASAPLAGLLVGIAACSSSSSSPSTTTGPSSCPADPFSTTGADTVDVDRSSLCQRYVAALLAKAETLKCTIAPTPTCPATIDTFDRAWRAAYPGKCIDGYSAGALANCECRIAAYTSCDDFGKKPCQIFVISNPSETCDGDGGVDSGSDALPDTSAMDSPADTGDAGGGG